MKRDNVNLKSLTEYQEDWSPRSPHRESTKRGRGWFNLHRKWNGRVTILAYKTSRDDDDDDGMESAAL